jgi:hypothetical protein
MVTPVKVMLPLAVELYRTRVPDLEAAKSVVN